MVGVAAGHPGPSDLELLSSDNDNQSLTESEAEAKPRRKNSRSRLSKTKSDHNSDSSETKWVKYLTCHKYRAKLNLLKYQQNLYLSGQS